MKQLCQEFEFVDHHGSFVMASGEVPRSLFYSDKISLRPAGKATLVWNLDSKCRILRKMALMGSHPKNLEKARQIRCIFDMKNLEYVKQGIYA